MGSIRYKAPHRFLFLLLPILFFPAFTSLYAQNSGNAVLAEEIQKIEGLLKGPGRAGEERTGAFRRLARLLRLSGDLEGAAGAWDSAAREAPGKRDDRALLEGARLYIALGEYEKAEASIKTALLGGPEFVLARYLWAQLEAFRSGDIRILASLLNEDGYGDYKSSIYYTLWKISGDNGWMMRLLAEYPQSPEARMANEGPVKAVSAFWLLFPGRESIALAPPPSVSAPASAAPVKAAPAAAAPASDAAVMLQIGLYGREENAQAMAGRLKKAGFQPAVTRRRVNGNDYWSVKVPAGSDMNGSIMRLKDAGFEAFPVF